MKQIKYYFLKGDQRKGPFELDDLISQQINRKTLIWAEGYKDWLPAGEVKEISEKLPPDLYTTEKSKPDIYDRAYKIVRIVVIFIVCLFLINLATSYYAESDNHEQQTYVEHVMTIEEIEEANPLDYLSSTGSYRTNFWETKYKVKCELINKATVVSYKDIRVRFSLLSKTGTEIYSVDKTIYEKLTPTSSKIVDLKIDINSDDVQKLNWEIIDATPIN